MVRLTTVARVQLAVRSSMDHATDVETRRRGGTIWSRLRGMAPRGLDHSPKARPHQVGSG